MKRNVSHTFCLFLPFDTHQLLSVCQQSSSEARLAAHLSFFWCHSCPYPCCTQGRWQQGRYYFLLLSPLSDSLSSLLTHCHNFFFFFFSLTLVPFISDFPSVCLKGPDWKALRFKNCVTLMVTFPLHGKAGQRSCKCLIIQFILLFFSRAAGNCTTDCSTVKIW